tara:strand:- start:16703 stop:17812 length:1110 start_codon:yes stop_codon:yes gene_type:complete
MKSITYIISTPLTHRDSCRYGIDELISLGITVNIFEISQIVYPKIYTKNINISSDTSNIFHVKTNDELYGLFEKNTHDNIFISVGNLPKKILYNAKKHNCTVAIQMWGSIPLYTGVKQKLAKLLSPIKVIKKIMDKLYDSIVFRNIDYDFYLSISKLPGKRTVLCHCYDYYVDLLKLIDCPRVDQSSETIVFIDQMIPYHSDFIKFGNGFEVDAATYYRKLNKIFHSLEQKYHCEVVIAAHPRSQELKNYAELFDNREVFLNKSSELISTAKLTVTHYSTAINHSVLNNKEIFFLYSKELIRLGQYEQIKLMAYETKSCMINLEGGADFPLINKLPLDYYDEYKFKYISQRDDNMTNGNIIIKELLLDV